MVKKAKLQEDLKETKVSMFLQASLLEKIKVIAEKENTKPKELIEQALLSYIEEYQKEGST